MGNGRLDEDACFSLCCLSFMAFVLTWYQLVTCIQHSASLFVVTANQSDIWSVLCGIGPYIGWNTQMSVCVTMQVFCMLHSHAA